MPMAVTTVAGGLMPAVVLAGVVLIGLATVAGAWLARRHAARREICFGAAAGALLVIAGLHLLPDAWAGASQVGLPGWIVLGIAAASFLVTGIAARKGCACQEDREAAGGARTACALAVHRLLEGAALALISTVAVAVALAVHALAEGLAAGTLLSSVSRRRAALWLTIMCVSPLAGAVIAEVRPVSPSIEPVLLAIAAGVLGQAARVSLAAAFRHVRLAKVVLSTPAAATMIAAAVTLVAVRGVG
jgi:zinc transporter ZupT